MHVTALHLVPLLGAAKSKVPFYIAGGLLIGWALVVSMLIGRNPSFPSGSSAQRMLITVTAVLVVAAASMAVVTSGGGG